MPDYVHASSVTASNCVLWASFFPVFNSNPLGCSGVSWISGPQRHKGDSGILVLLCLWGRDLDIQCVVSMSASPSNLLEI